MNPTNYQPKHWNIGVDLAILRGTHGERPRRVGAETECRGVWGWVSSWQILAYFEGHRTLLLYLYDKNLRGTICISVRYSKFWGDLSPRPPVIYAHVRDESFIQAIDYKTLVGRLTLPHS